MGLFGDLSIGRTGLQTSSNALNTVAHNISNVGTEGYTRQQVSLSTRHFNVVSYATTSTSAKELGMGVRYAEARQVRDFFLDKTYRKESGRSAFYEVSFDAMVHIEDLLGESGDQNFQEAITDYWKTIQEMANDPSSAVTQGLFVSKAATLIQRATNVYSSITDYQDNLNIQVYNSVNKLNELGKRLVELNNQIVKIEVGGVEHANDLRDERNFILDQMAELCDITYSEDIDTYVNVEIEGTSFIKRGTIWEIGMGTNEYGYYTPFWPQNAKNYENSAGEKVYDPSTAPLINLEREISSDLDTDIGRLKAILLARGDHQAHGSDMEDLEYYEGTIAPSICMNIEAEFDQLISTIVQEVNKILKEAGYVDGTGNADDALFVRIVPDDDPNKGWYVGNIVINEKFLQKPTLVKMMKEDDSVDYETGEKLKNAFEETKYTLNPSISKESNFIDYYSDLIIQISNSGAVYQQIYESQEVTKTEAEYAREQIVGVSSDEELQYMIKFQNAYNAASRYINTVNEMLENMLAQFGA